MSDDETEARSGFRRLLGVTSVLAAHFIAFACVMITLCKTVPTYAYVFEKLGVKTPDATQRILHISQSCLQQPLLITFFVMLTDVAVVSVLAFKAPRKRWVLSAYSHIVLVAASLVLLYIGAWLMHAVSSMVP